MSIFSHKMQTNESPEKPGGLQVFIAAFNKESYYWLLVLPGIIWYLIFAYGPMYGLVISFKDFSPFKGIMASPWVGFLWFEQFFSSQFFWRLIWNTLLLNIYNIIFSFPVPIVLALLLNEIRHSWYKKTAQTISYLPHFVSTVVIVGMVVNFTSPVGGIINNIIVSLGGKTINSMVMPQWFRTLYVASGIWQ